MEKIIKPPSRFQLDIHELIQFKELFFFFAWRDIKVKYKQTLLGFLWAVLQPTLVMLIFVFFFAKLLKVPTDNLPAPIFYFSGLLLWNLFSTGLSAASNSMVENADIIKKIYFPRLIVPMSSVIVALFDFMMAFLVFLLMIGYYAYFDLLQFNFLLAIFYTTLALVIVIGCTFGLGLIFAALNVQYRDFRYIIPFFIQVLMFLSPVIYPLTLFDNQPILKSLLSLNPLSGAMSLGRAAYMDTSPDWASIGISGIGTLLLLIIGIFIFKKTEAYFADIA